MADDFYGNPFPTLGGWIKHPAGVAYQMSFMPYPVFADAAPHLMRGIYADADVLLYKAWKDVLGQYPSYTAQQIGDCTSFGSGHLVDLTECIQIALGHTKEEYKETCTEALYGAGRDIANMLHSWGDGCYGAALARAVVEYGVVPREAVGAYSGQRAKSWGNQGVPQDVRTKMAEHKIKTTSLVSTLAELDAALNNGYGIIVCSNQGFTMTRDQDGFCSPRGSWAHCMMIAGRRVTGRRGYLICQSWGDNVPSGPTALDQPSFSFWADPDTVASMLAERDSFVFSQFDGYPGQGLPSNWTYASAA